MCILILVIELSAYWAASTRSIIARPSWANAPARACDIKTSPAKSVKSLVLIEFLLKSMCIRNCDFGCGFRAAAAAEKSGQDKQGRPQCCGYAEAQDFADRCDRFERADQGQ